MKPRSPRAHVFVFPEQMHLPTGGNLYNRFFVEALRARQVDYTVLGLSDARYHAQASTGVVYWVDSVFLDQVDVVAEMARSDNAVCWLLHYLPSLVPTNDPQRAEAWRRREAKALKLAAGFLVTSELTGAELQRRQPARRPILVVPPAPCVRPAGPLRRGTDFHGLMVANLLPAKGVLDFLRALQTHLDADAAFTLDVAGRPDMDPVYAGACRAFVEGSPRLRTSVRFLGMRSLDQLRACYETSTVFISASRFESFGMAAQEARAFGLCLLLRDAGYIATHVVPGQNGFIYDSVDALAAGCVGLMRAPNRLRRLLARATALDTLATYTWDDAAARFVQQWQRVAPTFG